MKDLIKRPSDRPLIYARNYQPGEEVKIEVVNGDIYALKTDSESIQVTVVAISNESVQVRIDDFEFSVEAESDGYSKGETISVSREYLWPQENIVKAE